VRFIDCAFFTILTGATSSKTSRKDKKNAFDHKLNKKKHCKKSLPSLQEKIFVKLYHEVIHVTVMEGTARQIPGSVADSN
jgi:hypothetical protein